MPGGGPLNPNSPVYDPKAVDTQGYLIGTRGRSNRGINDTGASIPVPGKSLIVYPDATVMQELLVTVLIDIAGAKMPVGTKMMIENSQKAYSICRVWVTSYVKQYTQVDTAYQMFRAEWRTFRLIIPLQYRLMVEQVLYDLGYPWKGLCTGFGPVKG